MIIFVTCANDRLHNITGSVHVLHGCLTNSLVSFLFSNSVSAPLTINMHLLFIWFLVQYFFSVITSRGNLLVCVCGVKGRGALQMSTLRPSVGRAHTHARFTHWFFSCSFPYFNIRNIKYASNVGAYQCNLGDRQTVIVPWSMICSNIDFSI